MRTETKLEDMPTNPGMTTKHTPRNHPTAESPEPTANQTIGKDESKMAAKMAALNKTAWGDTKLPTVKREQNHVWKQKASFTTDEEHKIKPTAVRY